MTQPADIQIADFLKTSRTGAFKHITAQEVASGLQQRLISPTDIRQGTASLCGPATFLFNIARDKPDDYVQYVLDLYRTGKGRIGKLTVEPSKDCKNYKPPAGAIDPVDWIALASLRDSENSALDYDSVSDATAGITMPGTLAGWFRKAGYGLVENKTNVYFNKDVGDLKDAGYKHLTGYRVCLFVNAQVLHSSTARDSSTFPDHWVGLVSAVTISANDNLYMEVFTWGEKRRLPRKGFITVKHFADDFYGYVAAR